MHCGPGYFHLSRGERQPCVIQWWDSCFCLLCFCLLCSSLTSSLPLLQSPMMSGSMRSPYPFTPPRRARRVFGLNQVMCLLAFAEVGGEDNECACWVYQLDSFRTCCDKTELLTNINFPQYNVNIKGIEQMPELECLSCMQNHVKC